MIFGTALGWSHLATIALAIALAFLFGYSLTSLPLLRGGMALGAVVPIALASDTISIAIMEFVDNAIVLLIPGAIDAGLDDPGFYASLAVALLIAGAAAFPANRWLIARGKATRSCTNVMPTSTRRTSARPPRPGRRRTTPARPRGRARAEAGCGAAGPAAHDTRPPSRAGTG